MGLRTGRYQDRGLCLSYSPLVRSPAHCRSKAATTTALKTHVLMWTLVAWFFVLGNFPMTAKIQRVPKVHQNHESSSSSVGVENCGRWRVAVDTHGPAGPNSHCRATTIDNPHAPFLPFLWSVWRAASPISSLFSPSYQYVSPHLLSFPPIALTPHSAPTRPQALLFASANSVPCDRCDCCGDDVMKEVFGTGGRKVLFSDSNMDPFASGNS